MPYLVATVEGEGYVRDEGAVGLRLEFDRLRKLVITRLHFYPAPHLHWHPPLPQACTLDFDLNPRPNPPGLLRKRGSECQSILPLKFMVKIITSELSRLTLWLTHVDLHATVPC